MYYKTEDFLKDWKYESDSTLKILNALTDDSLAVKVTDIGRSLGFLAWHIKQSIGEMMNRTGLNITGYDERQEMPSTAAEIKDSYKLTSDSLVEEIKNKWNDDTLKLEDDMYGEKWKKGSTLGILILHQTHHRGQMTVLMRQAGLKVPGVYGPSYEEWTAFGMEPMK
jgi:uncharacterized damage-inducible protein DinB